MDSFDRRIVKEIQEMEKRMGRMLRNMGAPRMMPFLGEMGNDWQPGIDVYETATDFFILVDAAGLSPDNLAVTVDRNKVTVSGERQLPVRAGVLGVHQLEIERGRFVRTIALPSSVDIDGSASNCSNGILEIRLPKERRKGRVQIVVE